MNEKTDPLFPQRLSGRRDHQGHADGPGRKNQGGEPSPGSNMKMRPWIDQSQATGSEGCSSSMLGTVDPQTLAPSVLAVTLVRMNYQPTEGLSSEVLTAGPPSWHLTTQDPQPHLLTCPRCPASVTQKLVPTASHTLIPDPGPPSVPLAPHSQSPGISKSTGF